MPKITATLKLEVVFNLNPDDFPAWATEEGICKLLQERVNDFNGLTYENLPQLFQDVPDEVWESGITVEIKP